MIFFYIKSKMKIIFLFQLLYLPLHCINFNLQLMKRKILSFMFFALIATFWVSAQNNTLTQKEISEGWQLLFDGKSFDGWRICHGTEVPPAWIIEDGAMRILPRAEKPPVENATRGQHSGGDILYGKKKFSNFELSIDWKIGKGGNSGIFYYIVEVPGEPMYIGAPEIQVLDNWNAQDNKPPSHLAGSLYDMIAPEPSNAKPHDEWNTMVVRVKDGHVTHTQNGVKVVEYTLWTPEWYEMVAKSKFRNWELFKTGPAKEGYIGVQDHNDFGAWFRNIKIREL